MKIHIANIPAKMEEAELMQLFVQYGQVGVLKIFKDKQTGKRKDTGYVEMRVAEQAQKAIDHLNGFTIMGTTLAVCGESPSPGDQP